jgi:hypothetical protein
MNPKTSQDLFNKIRSQFSNIRLGDENGSATADPSEANFFEFEFQPDSDTFGSVSISIADGENMKVYYNRDLIEKIDESDRDEWYAFLKELKDFAVEHSLRFDVRDITKTNLTKQDYQNLADTNKTVNTDGMSEELSRITKLAGISEGLSGTSKSSFENLDKTKLIIRHKGKVDETVPGARSRQIQSLYIENEDGERFKYPLTHLAGARAMTRHVANGGRPHDEFGQHIIQTSEDIAKLQSFSRYVANKDQLNDSAGDIIENTKLKLENLRDYMRNLSKQSHYENASKDFKTSEEQILDDETVAKLREKFTMTNLDKRVEDAFPLINRVMAELENAPKEEQINELEPDEEPIDAPIEPPVDHGAIVQSFLTDPENKLILRKDPSADKMLSVTNFKDKNTMLGSILSDIASRLLTKTSEEDRVANFASRIADNLEMENSASFKPDADYAKNKKIAIQLAKRYIDDYKKMQKDPAYADAVRMDPEDFNPKKHPKLAKRARGEAAEFEAWAESVVNEGGVKRQMEDDAEKMSKKEFVEKYGEDMAEFWHNYNGVEEYATEPKDLEDKEAKLKAIQDIQMDPNTAKDGELIRKMIQRKKELMKSKFKQPMKMGEGTMIGGIVSYDRQDPEEFKQAYLRYKDFMSEPRPASEETVDMILSFMFDDELLDDMITAEEDGVKDVRDMVQKRIDDLELFDKEVRPELEKMGMQKIMNSEEPAQEGNQFAQAVQKAKAAGMKAGDKFKVGDQEYTLKDAIELAGLQLEDFFSEEEQAYDNQIARIKNLANYQ